MPTVGKQETEFGQKIKVCEQSLFFKLLKGQINFYSDNCTVSLGLKTHLLWLPEQVIVVRSTREPKCDSIVNQCFTSGLEEPAWEFHSSQKSHFQHQNLANMICFRYCIALALNVGTRWKPGVLKTSKMNIIPKKSWANFWGSSTVFWVFRNASMQISVCVTVVP